MAKRRTIGENPLDALITKSPADPSEPEAVDVEKAGAGLQAEALQEGANPEIAVQEDAAPEVGAPKVAAPKVADPEVVAQYLTFYLASEEYAIGILKVREIVEYDTFTRVPATPPWIRGVMNLRGSVVPVVDLALKFGLPETAITKQTCVVIVEVELESEQTVMGVMVDAVSRVIDLAVEAIEEPPAFGTRLHMDFLLGMGIVEQKFVLILDIDRVLSTDELLAAAAAPTALKTADEELVAAALVAAAAETSSDCEEASSPGALLSSLETVDKPHTEAGDQP